MAGSVEADGTAGLGTGHLPSPHTGPGEEGDETLPADNDVPRQPFCPVRQLFWPV